MVSQLARDPGLARECLRDLTGERAERALTVLARAWAHDDAARAIMATALHADLPHLAIPAARVALQTWPEMGGLLAIALRDTQAPLEVLIGIEQALPDASVVLAQAHLAVTLRIRDTLPKDAEPQTVAEWDERAGTMLGELGRAAEAMARIREAVATFRGWPRPSPTATSLPSHNP